jgi:phage baseplate assembly protein gpV
VTNTAQRTTIVERPDVKINGAPLDDKLEANLIDARVELVTNGVSQATLRFYDADFELLGASLKIGAAVEISFPAPTPNTTVSVFMGEVLALAAEQGPNDLHELVVTAFDHGHRMSGRVVPVTYTNMTYSNIVRAIAGRAGLKATVASTTIQFPHLLQTTDDRTFLTEISERAGMPWRVANKELIFGAAAGAEVTVRWGDQLRRFTTRVNGAGPFKAVEVRGWGVRTRQAHVGVAAQVSPTLSAAGLSAASRQAAYNLSTGKKKIVTRRITDSQNEAEMLANSVRGRLDSGLTQARGEVYGDPALVPGTKLKVEGMGEAFSGTYLLTSVEHVYSPSGYVTRFHAGASSASTLVDLLDGPVGEFHGATIGVVTNHKDDDLGCGRVKVRLPMLGDNIESDWARVVSLGAGPQRGLQITPAVNDEVLVIFEGGDLRRPIVIGGLWNGSDKPPKAATDVTDGGKTTKWLLRTRAGHELTFDDTAAGNKENVTVLLKDGKTKLYLGVDKVELWANDKSLEIKSGQASILLNMGNVTIDANNITLKARQAVKVEGATVDIAAQTQAKVTATMMDVKANATLNLEASGITSVKGALVKIN